MNEILGAMVLGFVVLICVVIFIGLLENMFKDPGGRS